MKRGLIILSSILSLMLMNSCEKNTLSTNSLLLNSGTTSSLNSVYFTDNNTGFAVGLNSEEPNKGIILKTIDAGKSWNEVQFNNDKQSTTVLTSVFFTSSDIGYAAGWAGTIIKTENAGASWNALTSGNINDLHSIFFTDADTGYAVGFGRALIKTDNGGESWSPISFGGVTYYANLNSVFVLNSKNGFAVGNDGVMLKTINPIYSGGFSWVEELHLNSNEKPKYLLSIHFVNANTGFAVGGSDNKGTVLKTIDGGNSWSVIFSDTNLLFSVYFTSPTNGYAVGQGGTIIKTTDGGDTWTKIESGTENTLMSIFFPSNKVGYIVGTEGVIIKIED
jgi:photosystem II stability/assembly factor-like uncharacterized protein